MNEEKNRKNRGSVRLRGIRREIQPYTECSGALRLCLSIQGGCRRRQALLRSASAIRKENVPMVIPCSSRLCSSISSYICQHQPEA